MTEEKRKYYRDYRKRNADKIRDIKRRYRLRIKPRKNHGIFIYNENEEHFFKTQKEAAQFLGVSCPAIFRAVHGQTKCKGWQAEEAL